MIGTSNARASHQPCGAVISWLTIIRALLFGAATFIAIMVSTSNEFEGDEQRLAAVAAVLVVIASAIPA